MHEEGYQPLLWQAVTYYHVIITTYCKLYLVYAYLSKQAHYVNTNRAHIRGVRELEAIKSSKIYKSHGGSGLQG